MPLKRACTTVAMILVAVVSTPFSLSAQESDADLPRPIPVRIDSMHRLHVTTLGDVIEESRADAERGLCSAVATHTDANFEGGAFVAQAGFSEGEWAAASYTLTPSQFPLIVDRIEMVFATSGTQVTTTTEWSVAVWEGTPNNGTMVAMFSSDGTILPHIVLPPGTNGINVLVEVDPSDPEQIVVANNGSNTFTVGYRIDEHHNQTANPCFTAPPSASNAFPVTDTSGLSSPSGNWLFGLNCGIFGCPPNGGWVTFGALNPLCRPSGDWVIRANYTSVNCTGEVGACCVNDGICLELTVAECESIPGTFNGIDTTCAEFSCWFGACCLPDGSCVDGVYETDCEIDLLGQFQGDQTNCATESCPELPQACCFPAGCVNLTPSNCLGAGGTPGGPGTACATFNCNPTGACCLPDGSCVDAISPDDCAIAEGNYQGDNTACSTVSCPDPFGACCFSTGFCLELTQPDCTVAGGTWAGALTDCETGCDEPCPGDADGNNSVDLDDLNMVLTQFGQSGDDLDGDVDGNGSVDLDDLNMVLTAFGQSC